MPDMRERQSEKAPWSFN